MSTDKIKQSLDLAEEQMKKALQHLENELIKVRAGKANPAMLENVQVDYYGSYVPLHNVGSVSAPDARTLVIQPWEKSMLTPIEKAVQAANLGFNPQNDGTIIRINVPPLTEERRKDLVKRARTEAENCKVTLRTARRDANEQLKKLSKEGVPEDSIKSAEAKIQTLTDNYSLKVDKVIELKEKEIMTV
jgi:ribosome recycling factor